jgi:hypothetical protein
MEDVRSWLAMPWTGSVETAAAPFWRAIPSHVRLVTIRRPPGEVVQSSVALGFGRTASERLIWRMAAKLDQIEARREVIRIEFAELETIEGARALWLATIGGPFDANRYESLRDVNIQFPTDLMMRYYAAHSGQLAAFAAEARRAARPRRTWHRPLVKEIA